MLGDYERILIMPQASYIKNALAGFSAQTILKIGRAGLAVAKMFVLARLLTPTDFGTFSLVLIALGVTESFTQTGVNITIINSKKSVSYFLDTAWVIAIMRGFIIGSIMIGIGFGMSQFLNQPELLYLTTIAALIPVIKGFINPAIISYQKKLQFFSESIYLLALQLIEVVGAVLLALVIPNVWSLILALIMGALAEVVISFKIFDVKPQFKYIHSRATEIFDNARGISLATLLTYLHENADNLLVRVLTSTADLGIYHTTYSLSHRLNYDFAKSAGHSIFPILAQFKNDRTRVRRAILKSLIATLGLGTVLSIPFMVFPEQAILLLLGEQWLSGASILPWLIVAGLVQSISIFFYNGFLIKKRYTAINMHLAVTVMLMLSCMWWFGTRYGLQGAVVGILVSRVLTLPLLVWQGYSQVFEIKK